MTMENKEETQNAAQATVLQDGKTAITGNDSSEDPDNEAPTTSTESEEATSAESVPPSESATNAEKIQQLDKELKNLDAGGKKDEPAKTDDIDTKDATQTGKSQNQPEDEDSDSSSDNSKSNTWVRGLLAISNRLLRPSPTTT